MVPTSINPVVTEGILPRVITPSHRSPRGITGADALAPVANEGILSQE